MLYSKEKILLKKKKVLYLTIIYNNNILYIFIIWYIKIYNI